MITSTVGTEDFDLDTCPDIDMIDFPTKPNLEISAKECLKMNSLIENSRLANAIAAQNDREKSRLGEKVASAPCQPEIKLKKGLEKLPPAIVAAILAKEKAKQIREMSESVEGKQEKATIKELIQVFTVFMISCNGITVYNILYMH